MENKPTVDWKRVSIYILFAYGIAWLTALAIARRGGLIDSPEVASGNGMTEAYLLITTLYMFAPGISHTLTRLVTREGWENAWIKPNLKTGWRYWLAAWFGTPVLIAIGAVIYFLIFPQHFDASLSALSEAMVQMEEITGEANQLTPGTFIAIQIAMGVLISPFANLIPVFGEEFGWRAYLQPNLLPLGRRKALLLTGLIWGLWHAPLIAMGYNYGLEYPGAPWTGILAFTIVPVAYAVFFGWATLQANSFWPALIGHAVLNGIGSVVVFFIQGEPNPLLGPTAAGLIGASGFILAAVLILLRPGKDVPESGVLEETE